MLDGWPLQPKSSCGTLQSPQPAVSAGSASKVRPSAAHGESLCYWKGRGALRSYNRVWFLRAPSLCWSALMARHTYCRAECSTHGRPYRDSQVQQAGRCLWSAERCFTMQSLLFLSDALTKMGAHRELPSYLPRGRVVGGIRCPVNKLHKHPCWRCQLVAAATWQPLCT